MLLTYHDSIDNMLCNGNFYVCRIILRYKMVMHEFNKDKYYNYNVIALQMMNNFVFIIGDDNALTF